MEKERYLFLSDMTPKERVGWLFISSVLLAICLVLAYFVMRTPPTLAAQEVKAEEEVLTVNMNSSVLIEALEERATDWCKVSRTIPIIGDIVISSREGNTGMQLYDIMMLTDSMAPKMAKEYPHLFKYREKDGIKQFQMSASTNSITVPVWFVKGLLDRHILKLPDETPTN